MLVTETWKKNLHFGPWTGEYLKRLQSVYLVYLYTTSLTWAGHGFRTSTENETDGHGHHDNNTNLMIKKNKTCRLHAWLSQFVRWYQLIVLKIQVFLVVYFKATIVLLYIMKKGLQIVSCFRLKFIEKNKGFNHRCLLAINESLLNSILILHLLKCYLLDLVMTSFRS